jgi:hypothetical protein
MKPVLHPGLLLPTSGPKKISHQEPRNCDSSVVSGNQLLDTLSNGLKDKTLLAMLVMGTAPCRFSCSWLGSIAVCQLSACAATTSSPIGYALLLFHNIRFLG